MFIDRMNPPGQDLQTSRFSAGGRGVVLAALKQRFHSAPPRREVRVQLLHTGQPDPQHAPGSSTPQHAPGPSSPQHANGPSSPQHAVRPSAAPLMKTHSDLDQEARVSGLADGVQELLQADRGRGISQLTLQHLETLHSQQLQQQSQLLGSALRMLTDHVPRTSDPQPSCLQVTHLDSAENVLSNQQQISTATGAAAVSLETVTTATQGCDQRLEHTRQDPRGPPRGSKAAGSHLRSSSNESKRAVRRANETLQDMSCLKREMKTLLRHPEESLKTRASGPDQHQQTQTLQSEDQNQPNPGHLQSSQPQAIHSQSHQSMSNGSPLTNQGLFKPTKAQQNHSQSHQTQSNQSPSQQIQSQQKPTLPNHVQSQSHWPQQTESQISLNQSSHQPLPVWRRPAVRSPLEEAGLVLRQVRRQKKVLEENLEALLRTRTGEVLHVQLEALAANRDCTQEVRIKKTVDAWINSLTRDIQAEMSSEEAMMTSQQQVAGNSAPTRSGRPVSMLTATGSQAAGGRVRTGSEAAGGRVRKGSEAAGGRGRTGSEAYLSHLYGRATYKGQRRSLKTSPYLRLSSPAPPPSRKPRSRLLETVTGVKVKSCKTQTCLTPPLMPAPGRLHDIIISPALLTSGDLKLTPVARAIPLGRPRMDSSSRRLPESQQARHPPEHPPEVAVEDRAPELQVDQLRSAGEAPLLPPTDTMEMRREEEEGDEEEEEVEVSFPGTHFLSVAEVAQLEEGSSVGEERSAVVEDAMQLDGGVSPPPVQYQGPVFPPQPRSSLPPHEEASLLGLQLQRDGLEQRLLEWVEQQLMSRMISEMYRPPLPDPAYNLSIDQSESEEQSFTSDTALQLCVVSGVPVDSALVRQLVTEVLTEQVDLMLGERDSGRPETRPDPEIRPEPGAGPDPCEQDSGPPLVLTPAPTPPPSPATPSRETSPLATPSPSEPTSIRSPEPPQPITEPGQSQLLSIQ
ncbi:hypothetical protein PBY51_011267 [Eleginops maclovinus]|uniref:Protein TALPID3 n=1 Tax=Eleginops maclovinus TaxID=56733 RepID=A0AAN8AFJ0_ELEMC|nr:hypothetical protein PBY51_011267 [Eleginops maclovinus]